MRKIFFAASILSALFLGGCIKNDPITYNEQKIEFDAASWNNNAAGQTFPIMNRIPLLGAQTPTDGAAATQPFITRTTPSFTIRVNLLGAQKSTATDFTYTVNAASTAVPGTHFTALTGIGTIPANSSFGFITITAVNPGVSSPTPAVLILELTPNDNYKVNTNYAKFGMSISQL